MNKYLPTKNKMSSRELLLDFLFFFAFFFLVFRFIREWPFDTDEGDIFAGGMALSNGFVLYKDYLSQHMPFSYFLSALFWFFGADSVFCQRICFYVFYSISWLFIVKRYSNLFSKTSLVVAISFFISISLTIDLGTQILSDHIAAIGFFILYCEFIKYASSNEGRLSFSESSFISFALLCTFGTTFVSLFALFPLFCGFLFVYFKKVLKLNKLSIKNFCNFKKICIIILIIFFPWFAYLLYCLFTNSLSDFYYWNYSFNRDVYSKYLGGFGGSVSHVLKDTISNYFAFFINNVDAVLSNKINYFDFLKFLLYIFSIMYIVVKIIDGQYLIAFVSLFIVVYTGTRGMFNFHSTPQTMLMCLMSSNFGITLCTKSNNNFFKLLYGILCLGFWTPYLSTLNTYPSFKINTYTENPNPISTYIRSITNKGDTVWQFALASNSIFINSGRVPIKQFAIVPWFWDATGLSAIEKSINNLPKVIIYNENQEVWGHKISDYAKGLSDFMRKHYIKHEHMLYIRKDYYQTALSIINSYNLHSGVTVGAITKDSVFEQEVVFKQSDFSRLGLFMATYARKNSSNLHFSLRHLQTGKLIEEKSINSRRIHDNAWLFFEVNRDKINLNEKYIVKLTSDADENNAVTWWFSPHNSGNASVNGNVLEGGFSWMLD